FKSVSSDLGGRGLALLHEVVPGAATIGFLENPSNPVFELTTRDVLAAASVMGLKVQRLEAHSDREIEAVRASSKRKPTRCLSAVTCFSTTGSNKSLRSQHAMRFRRSTRFVSSYRRAAPSGCGWGTGEI